jgi:hypothetical protein
MIHEAVAIGSRLNAKRAGVTLEEMLAGAAGGTLQKRLSDTY